MNAQTNANMWKDLPDFEYSQTNPTIPCQVPVLPSKLQTVPTTPSSIVGPRNNTALQKLQEKIRFKDMQAEAYNNPRHKNIRLCHSEINGDYYDWDSDSDSD